MSMFAKFCRDKEPDCGPAPVEPALPNQFDTGRRTSVSAECWMQACDSYQCSQTARLPPKSGSRTANSMTPTKRSGDQLDSRQSTPGGIATATATNPADSQDSHVAGDVDASAETFPPAHLSKEEEQAYARIAKTLRSTIFFEELSDDLMQQVLKALRKREVDAGVAVIQQGNEGDDLFVLDQGRVEYLRDGQRVGEASSCSTFGELALLYNSPRAATVRTLEPSVVYTLDRITFKRIMVAKLSRKRVHSQQVLASIDVFASLPESTQLRIADALHPSTYHRGDTVIKQGDSGYDFYLIDEGNVDVSIDGKVVGTLGSGSYFGELALIYDLPRAATITATSENLKLEVLSSSGFEKLIGPELVCELRKRDPRR